MDKTFYYVTVVNWWFTMWYCLISKISWFSERRQKGE